MKKDVYKNGITLNLGKAHTKTSSSTTQNNVLNFSLLCIETHTHPHTHTHTHKHTKSVVEIIKTVHVLELQNFINYERMNPAEITFDSNEIVEDLSKYKIFKYRFLIESLLFSSNFQNDTDVIFITCNGLSDAREALISSKLYKALGAVYLSEEKKLVSCER